MKVGIVSTPLYANYGGILQNYALQQVLKKMGHEPITLDYMPSLPFWKYCLYAGKTALCSVIPSKRHPLKPYHHFLQRPGEIKRFVDENIAHTATAASYSSQQLSKYGIEALVVGSDQVWRYEYNHFHIDDMYLAFAKDNRCRKIAYAASFGVEKWDYPAEVTSRVRTLIKSFDAISVRESSGIDICRDSLGADAQLVLDPTLLLSEEDYAPLCKPFEKGGEPYVASYILDTDDRKQKMVEDFAAENGLAVRNMTVSENGCAIEDWLSTIRNAEFVITDSFHGSIFSVIFKKQFFTFINRDRGADRFYTLFNALNLRYRLLDEDVPTIPSVNSVDYHDVNMELKSLKKESIAYLKRNV